MDVGPIVKIFDALLTAGAAVAAVVSAFFIKLGGFQYVLRAVAVATCWRRVYARLCDPLTANALQRRPA